MKKKKIGIIASAIATSAICASMIAGSTFALFTSSDEVNMTVTAGNVDVIWSVANEKIQRGIVDMETGAVEGYADLTDGSATVTFANKALTVNNVIAGDKVEFDLIVTNAGTATANYQYAFEGSGSPVLLNDMNWTVTLGESIILNTPGLHNYVSAWETDFAAKAVHTYKVTIVVDGKSEAKGETANIGLNLFAVQGNAKVDKEAAAVLKQVPAEALVYDSIVEVEKANPLYKAMRTGGGYILMDNNVTAPNTFSFRERDAYLNLGGNTLTINNLKVQAYAATNINGGGIDVTVANGAINTLDGVYLDGDTSVTTFENVALTSVGTQIIQAGYGDKAVIKSGSYGAQGLIYGADKIDGKVSTNYYVDAVNNTLTDASKNVFEFESVEWEYNEEKAAVVLKVGAWVSDNQDKFHSIIGEDGYLYDNNNSIAIANRFTLNLRDDSRGKSFITVLGGSYKNFNPGNNWAELSHTNFVPEGYTVVYEKDAANELWFTVVEESALESYKAAHPDCIESAPVRGVNDHYDVKYNK